MLSHLNKLQLCVLLRTLLLRYSLCGDFLRLHVSQHIIIIWKLYNVLLIENPLKLPTWQKLTSFFVVTLAGCWYSYVCRRPFVAATQELQTIYYRVYSIIFEP